RPERLDLRSYARQGIDKIPTVHMGPAACQMEKKGIQTSIGNLNRDIKAANSLMQSIRQMVRHLKGWIADLKEKKAALMEALEQTKEPTIPELLSQYLELRSGQRADWTSRGKLKGTVADFNKVQAAMDFLRKKGISTVESLDTRLDEISQTAVSVMEGVKKSEKRIKAIDTMLSYIDKYEA
ncbi:conjugal transfer protein, partial [bacterium 1XD42-76]|nr:conjugal transfer protein [bacterium 1XD42-76]